MSLQQRYKQGGTHLPKNIRREVRQHKESRYYMFKSGYAVIVGRPNVGKSTLMNHLIGQKIAITSNRPQTTRGRIETVYTNERGQIIFLDTPGMIRKADNKLGEYLIDVSNKTIGDADVVLWLIEPSAYIGKGDQMIAEKLTKSGKPVILIINKIDTIDKKKAAEIIEAWRVYADLRTSLQSPPSGRSIWMRS